MDERRSARRLRWRGALVVLALTTGWLLPSAAGSAQTNDAQSRLCSRLQAALTRVGDRGSAGQALVARLQRFGCATTGPTTTVGACPLPGGGVGPCPTTTGAPGTSVPGGPTTTGSPSTTFVPTTSTLVPPTTSPGGSTTIAPSTTLLPCSPTTTGQFPPTTVPCVP